MGSETVIPTASLHRGCEGRFSGARVSSPRPARYPFH